MKIKDIYNLIEKLPESPGVLEKNKYNNSAVIVPLILINNEYYFLFQKRAKNVRQGGEICFPGGMFEKDKDKNLEQTAIRETIEEIGITKKQLKIIGQLDTYVSLMGTTVDSFISILNIKDLNQLKLNKKEVEEVFTIPVSFFQKNKPEIYYSRVLIQSQYIDKNGKKKILLPSKDLGLPDRYYNTWGGSKRQILVYKTENHIIWGITAGIIFDFIQKLK